jgi:hypothetical protein
MSNDSFSYSQLKSSIFNKRACFLAKPEWIERPFQGQPMSLAQSLFNQAVHLPNLLEHFANLTLSSPAADLVAWIQLHLGLELLLRRFQEWEEAAQKEHSSPLYMSKPNNRHLSGCDIHAPWFRDPMTATSLTFCWAFKIIVLKHLDLVRHTIGTLKTSMEPRREQAEEPSNCKQRAKLAEMLCNSMPYFMRPEMKLWGHASTFFTFTTAVQTFKDNEADYRPQLLRCQRIHNRLNEMKVYFPGIQELVS